MSKKYRKNFIFKCGRVSYTTCTIFIYFIYDLPEKISAIRLATKNQPFKKLAFWPPSRNNFPVIKKANEKNEMPELNLDHVLSQQAVKKKIHTLTVYRLCQSKVKVSWQFSYK
jgi:hypothetical protein